MQARNVIGEPLQTSFDFETVYVLNTPDYNRHMDILQDLQLRVLDWLEKEGIDLAEQAQILRLERPEERDGVTGHEVGKRKG
jgi:hypothetical protein